MVRTVETHPSRKVNILRQKIGVVLTVFEGAIKRSISGKINIKTEDFCALSMRNNVGALVFPLITLIHVELKIFWNFHFLLPLLIIQWDLAGQTRLRAITRKAHGIIVYSLLH